MVAPVTVSYHAGTRKSLSRARDYYSRPRRHPQDALQVNPNPVRKGLLRHILGFVVAACLLLNLGGCNEETQIKGVALAKVGAATATTMAGYYDGLAQGEQENYRAFVFTNRARLTGDNPQLADDLLQEEDHYKKLCTQLTQQFKQRGRAARQLAATYLALEDLASYDATAEVQRATGALATELQGLKVLPTEAFGSSTPASVSGLAQYAAGLLISAKQSRDIRKGAKAINVALEQWQKLATAESPVYLARSESRINQLREVVNVANDQGHIGAGSLFQDVFALYGVRSVADAASPATSGQIAGVKAILDDQQAELKAAATTSSILIERSLSELLAEHKKFEQKEPLTLGALAADVNRFQNDLDLLFPSQ